MSVVLDALKRARRGKAPETVSSQPVSPSVPAGLLNASVRTGRSAKAPAKTRWGLLAGVVVVAASIYAGVRFGLGAMSGQAAAPTEEFRTWQPVSVGSPVPAPADPPATAQPNALPAPESSAPVTATIERPVATRADQAAPRAATPRSDRQPAPAAARVIPAVPVPVTPAAPAPAVDHFELAVRYHRLGNFEQALKHYVAILEADEFNVEARNNLGLLYSERGLVDDAIAQFRRALLIDPEYLRARSNLAVVLMNVGRLSEARAELRAALSVDPRNADLLVNMALVDKADGHPEQAKETLLRALGLQPTHAAAHYNLALLYEQSGDRAKAHDHYDAFLKTAGPEHGGLLTEVRRRMDVLKGGT
jgi:Tfp pilus assembly protein PilF